MYKGSKKCAACGEPARHLPWKSENRAICVSCDKLIEAGEKSMREAGESTERVISIKRASYSPAPYAVSTRLDFGIDFSNRQNRAKTMSPSYIGDRDAAYTSRMLNEAINQFLSELSRFCPEKNGEWIHCDDGTHFGEYVKLRYEHAIAWVKFYDEFSQYCDQLVKIGENKGRNYLVALMNKEVELYQG